MAEVKRIEVATMYDAWSKARELFGHDFLMDDAASKIAGYNIFRAVGNGCAWISELCDHLELNMADGNTINIWLKRYTSEEVKAVITECMNTGLMIDKIKEIVAQYAQKTEYAKHLNDALVREKINIEKRLAEFWL